MANVIQVEAAAASFITPSLSSQSSCLFPASFPHSHHSILHLSYIPIKVDPDGETFSSLTPPPSLLPLQLCGGAQLVSQSPFSHLQPFTFSCPNRGPHAPLMKRRHLIAMWRGSCYGVGSELRLWLSPEEHNYISNLTFPLLRTQPTSRPRVHCSMDDSELRLVCSVSLWLGFSPT